MPTPESYYLRALKSALQGNLSDALELQYRAEKARESYGMSFSEGASDEFPFIEEAINTLLNSYDFARCVRPDGSVYGTRGKCRKGTEQAKSSSTKLEKEMVRAGGKFQLPGRPAQDTDEANEAAKERVKKRLAAEKARKERIKALDETTSKMANTLFSSRGGVSDGSIRAQNGVKNMEEYLRAAHAAGRGSKTTQLISKGDLKGLLKHAEEVTSRGVQEHAKTRMEEERTRQKAEMKDMLAKAKERGDSKEDIAKMRRDANFYNRRDLQRAKAQAETEYNSLWGILRG